MGMEEDRLKAMLWQTPDQIPIGVGFLPATWARYRDALDELVARHPVLFGPGAGHSEDYDAAHGTYVEGEHVDAWGCVWSNLHRGCESIVTGHPIPTRAHVRDYAPPAPGAGIPHGFMWLRLADLRGFEEIMVDFAEEPEELQVLIDKVLAYNVAELRRILAENPTRLLYFGDDLGMQNALAIKPEKWRKYLKPCYAALYGMCRQADRYVYMHTDGHILPIIPDLIDCGVNVVNPQVRANGLEGLARVCKGKVCVALDLDRQMFPFCTAADVDAHVREAIEALGSPEGGLWLHAECGPDVPLEIIEAICASLERHRGWFGKG